MIVGFTTTCAICADYHKSSEYYPVLGEVYWIQYYKVCQWLVTCLWFSPGTPVSSNNKTERNDIAEILLKVALSTINQPNQPSKLVLHEGRKLYYGYLGWPLVWERLQFLFWWMSWKDRSKFSKHSASPTCQLCKSEPEDRLHFLVKCKALEEIRTPFINKLRCYLIDIIRPKLLQELLDNSGNLLQLIIDCSRFHFLSLNQQHRIEKIAAGLCFNLHQKRASLLL
jgi:hypothetical protein